jgi:hypothetical protein
MLKVLQYAENFVIISSEIKDINTAKEKILGRSLATHSENVKSLLSISMWREDSEIHRIFPIDPPPK